MFLVLSNKQSKTQIYSVNNDLKHKIYKAINLRGWNQSTFVISVLINDISD